MSGNTIQNVLKVSTVEDKKKLFKCFTCDSKFSNPKDLLEHITLDHVSNNPKKYSKAEIPFAIKEDKEMLEPENISQQCDNSVHEEKKKDEHKHSEHTSSFREKRKNEKFMCAFCPQELPSKLELNKHLPSHEKEFPLNFYKCEKCGKAFYEKVSLYHHNFTVHEGKKLFECSMCDTKYTTEHALTRHVDVVHEGKEPFKCPNCDFRFPTRELKLEHIELNHKKRDPTEKFICPYDNCLAELASKKGLKTHISAVHEGIKCQYEKGVCPICDKVFSNKSYVAIHIATFHEGERPHECSKCGAKYKHQNSLLGHISSVHEGKKPFSCKICSASFTEKGSMLRHMTYTHEEKKDKVYHCEICSTSFTGKKSLEKHVISVHEEIMLEKCFYCEKEFLNHSALRRHIASTHKEFPLTRETKHGTKNYTQSCSIQNCSTYGKVGFYNLPRDPLLNEAWIKACKLSPNNVIQTTVICGKHFGKSDFITGTVVDFDLGIGLLKKNAVPSQNLPGDLDLDLVIHEEPKVVNGRKCAVPTCNYKSLKNQGFFKIPEGETRRNSWLKACNLSNTNKITRICYQHFKVRDFVNNIAELSDIGETIENGGIGRLKKGAVPSKNLPKNLNEAEIMDAKHLIKNEEEFSYCSVPGCSTYSREKVFYTISENKEDKRQLWIDLCSLPSETSEMSKICWRHFKISDFDHDFDPLSNIDEIANSVGLGALKKNALPSVNLPDRKSYEVNTDYEPQFKKEKNF